MATYRHRSVSLWRDPYDVPHCQILSPDKTEWQLILATLWRWRCCFVADQSSSSSQMHVMNHNWLTSLLLVRVSWTITGYIPVWNCCAGNKLHAIKPTVGGYKQKTCLSRRDAVLLNRLRISRTRLMHSYLLSGDDIPECSTCQCPLPTNSEAHPDWMCWSQWRTK